jgi:hypothetical protein
MSKVRCVLLYIPGEWFGTMGEMRNKIKKDLSQIKDLKRQFQKTRRYNLHFALEK